MTRGAIMGLLLACLLLAASDRAADAQQQPPQPDAQPGPPQSAVPPAAARARVQSTASDARRRYGRGSQQYYRRVFQELKAVTRPAAAPSAPEAAPPRRAAGPRPSGVRVRALIRGRTVRRSLDVVVEEVNDGLSNTFLQRFVGNLPTTALPQPVEAKRIVSSARPIADAAEKANLIVAAIAPGGGRGIAGAVSSIRAPVRPGLKERVAGLDFTALPQELAAVERDPNDPYSDTVALGTLVPGSALPRPESLCSGVLVGRNGDVGAVLTAAHCVCGGLPKTHVFIGYNVVKTPSCVREPDFDTLRIVDTKLMRSDACNGPEARRGADIALVFFRKPSPDKRSYFLDAIIQDRTAIIPDQAMMEVLSAGLSELEEMEKRALQRAATWAVSLGIEPEDVANDLKTYAEFQAMVDSLMVTRPPVGLTAVGFGATARSGAASTSGCKGWAHFTQKDYLRCVADDGPDAGDCVAGKEFALQDADDGPNDTCNGDSGGAIYAETIDANRRYVRYLVGLTSRAAKKQQSGDSCGQGGIYSLLARNEVIDFLQRGLKSHGLAPKIKQWSKTLAAPSQN